MSESPEIPEDHVLYWSSLQEFILQGRIEQVREFILQERIEQVREFILQGIEQVSEFILRG